MPQLTDKLLENSADAIILIEVNGHSGDAQVLWFNSAAQHLLALRTKSEMELLSKYIDKAVLSKILSNYSYEFSSSALIQRQSLNFKLCALTLDVSSAEPGNATRLICFKSRSPQSENTQKQDDFLATIAHDLKNPLGAIFGYADVLLDTAAGEGLSFAQRQVITKVRATASRCIDLVRNYQHMSELSHGIVSRAQAPVDLNLVVNNVIEYTWRENPHAPVLKLHLANNDLPVMLEKIFLDRVISNLFTNALKYTPADGEINISSRKENDQVIFEINNKPTYLKAEELSLVFERAKRGSSSLGTPGSGLGLYIVKSILDACAATIQLESSKGIGTTFRVKFKIADRPKAGQPN